MYLRLIVSVGLAVGFFALHSMESVAEERTPTQFEITSDDVEVIRKAAELGDTKAQYKLGLMYYEGISVPDNYAEAFYWFRRAAEQGVAEAQYNLGLMYEDGIGTPEDDLAALKWFRQAAEQGYAPAQYKVGMVYYVEDKTTEAVAWLNKAAEQGDAEAQYELGIMFFYGYGVPADSVQAVEWFKKAAEKGHEGAQYELDALDDNDDSVTNAPRSYAGMLIQFLSKAIILAFLGCLAFTFASVLALLGYFAVQCLLDLVRKDTRENLENKREPLNPGDGPEALGAYFTIVDDDERE